MSARRHAKFALFNVAFIGLVASVTLFASELLLRIRYAEPMRKTAPEILAIQEYLQLEPDIGFVWKTNVREEENIIFNLRDIEFPPLSTDALGFINPPESIQAMEHGIPVNVVGLGDSFMEHGAYTFRTLFKNVGLSYYNLAIHRQSPPQYLSILQKFSTPLHPDWVILGFFENDFEETEDYDQWRESGMDWFSYHSGLWYGPPVPTNPLKVFYLEHFPGVDGLMQAIRGRLRSERISFSGPTEAQIKRVSALLTETRKYAEAQGAHFLLVVIPSKVIAIHGNSPASNACDRIIEDLPEASVLDLRPMFASAPDPAALYYREDAHWNAEGIEIAGNAIVERIWKASSLDTSSNQLDALTRTSPGE